MDNVSEKKIFTKPIRAVLIGAGRRGIDIFGNFAREKPIHLKYVAVVEPNKKRRNFFAKMHNIPLDFRFDSVKKFLDNKPNELNVAINATCDKNHFSTTKPLLENGFHVLLEKPIATTYEECKILEKISLKNKRVLMICHVLRYSPFFKKLKLLIESNIIGKIKKIDLIENIGHSHFVHSYVRGNWNNSNVSGPISLTKTSHDFDIIVWLLNFKTCTNLFSYSTKIRFSEENSPGEVPSHCLKGCNFKENCNYYAPDYYLNSNSKKNRKRAVATSLDQKEIEEALKKGKYGRCVYKCDNNVPDTQITTMQFSNDAVANLIMSSDQEESTRRIAIKGTEGEIKGTLVEGHLTIKKNQQCKKIKVSLHTDPHGGGDFPLIYDFLLAIKNSNNSQRTLISQSLLSHKLAFEAEKSRQEYLKETESFILKNPDYRS